VKLVSWKKFVILHGNAEAWSYVYKQQADKLRVEKVLNTLLDRTIVSQIPWRKWLVAFCTFTSQKIENVTTVLSNG